MMQPVQSLLRPVSITLLLVTLLVQAYLLYHETEHAAAGDSDGCLVCQLAQQQDHALISLSLMIAASQFCAVQPIFPTIFIVIQTRYFPARAPPPTIHL